MIYHIHELLLKLGAPETRERHSMEWFYFNPKTQDVAGKAHIRFEAEGERLVAEIQAFGRDGNPLQDDTYFCIAAERTARPEHYRVVKVVFDGAAYDRPSKAVIELAASVFHARALDISIRMVEQSFNKQDVLEAKDAAPEAPKKRKTAPLFQTMTQAPEPAAPRTETFGIVVPFRPRHAQAASAVRA
jgi:hypothetical protein